MDYKKGQIISYGFPERATTSEKNSNVIRGSHRAVVLHKRGTPYNTILIAPITKAGSLESRDAVPSNYVKLKRVEYPFLLDVDSYINLDMTMPVDEKELTNCQNGSFKVSFKLNDFDLRELDYRITLTYELGKYLKEEFDKKVSDEFEVVVRYIDEEVKVEVEKVLSRIDDPDVIKDVISLIDLLLSQLKETYINKDR